MIELIGVVDVGGGLRGIYGAGIFDYCLDNNINFDYCIGVSAGSANIASYLGKQKGRNYTFYVDYTFRKEYMSFYNFLHNGSYIDLDYVYGNLSIASGENPLNYKGIIKSKSTFKIVSTDALTGKAVYFDKHDISQDNYDIFKASCCIPVVCKPYLINGIPYFDGGLSDPVPVAKAFKDGCTKVVAILTKPIELRDTDKKDIIMSKLLHKKYPAISKAMFTYTQEYNKGIKLLQQYEKEGKALIIAPDDCCGLDTLTKDPEKMKLLYNKGYKDAEALLNFLNISTPNNQFVTN